MQLLAVAALEPLLAGAQREGPVGAHLDVLVAGLQRLVVEGVARAPGSRVAQISVSCALVKRRPRKFGIGFDLAPHHVVEDPEAEILQDRADAEDVVIGADHPQRAGGLQHAPAGGQPGAGEFVVGREARELVPVVVDGVDLGIVGTLEVALELQIVRRIGEDEIDAVGRQLRHLGDAIADDDAGRIAARMAELKTDAGRPCGRPATRHTHDSEL